MSFEELLVQIGVDGPATVARLGGMETILRKFILKFPQDPTFPALAHAYDCRDLEALERHVHTLKGLTANLGIEPLRQLAAAYLTVLRQGASAEDLVDRQRGLTQEYRRVVKAISRFLEDHSA